MTLRLLATFFDPPLHGFSFINADDRPDQRSQRRRRREPFDQRGEDDGDAAYVDDSFNVIIHQGHLILLHPKFDFLHSNYIIIRLLDKQQVLPKDKYLHLMSKNYKV